ncbi:armadillo repeat-containing protein 10 isoform X1 [Hypanus sabinus]|uniref:armadillo repeat-containing protein 10 isoform X1 n=1 Tax=Hypanus sabinus TaxID=79690 RepID=UPI0028C425A5|nr:armadillo repeat-containing protein 10 isoform X1 [Hypanus sabinus]
MGTVVSEKWPLKFAMGVLAGCGGLYALYFLAKRWQDQEDQDTKHCQSRKRNLLYRAIGLRVDSQENANSRQGSILVNPHNSLEKQQVQVILGLLKGSSDTSIRESALVTIGNSAAFTVNQDLIRNLDGLSVVANCLLDEVTSIKVKAMNALTNLSLNVANQEELKVWIPQILKIQEAATLNSELQVAGLRMLTNFSVTNSHHHMMTKSIPHFLKLLVDGTDNIKVQVLKILVNLSANPELTHDFLCAQVPPLFLFLFDSTINKEVLIRILIFVVNLKENMNSMQGFGQYDYKVESVHSVLFGNPIKFSQKIAKLVLHQDDEVKQHAARIMV